VVNCRNISITPIFQFETLQKGAIMICSVWKKLHAEFVGIARKIERTDTRRSGGAERNRELNASARVLIERLQQHEREHGCKPSNYDLKADGERRLREAQQRVEARRGKTGR
jgi:hypothetical protein